MAVHEWVFANYPSGAKALFASRGRVMSPKLISIAEPLEHREVFVESSQQGVLSIA